MFPKTTFINTTLGTFVNKEYVLLIIIITYYNFYFNKYFLHFNIYLDHQM